MERASADSERVRDECFEFIVGGTGYDEDHEREETSG